MYVYIHIVTNQSAHVIFYGLQHFLCFLIIPEKKQNIYIESIYTAPLCVYTDTSRYFFVLNTWLNV